jgi:hypothetical protein
MLYKLLLYLVIDGNMMLVDSVYGEDLNAIKSEASDRKISNPEYVVFLLSYELAGAQVLE